MKNLLLIYLVLSGPLAFGQIKFENKKLILLQDIFYKTTKENINSFMESKGFEQGEVDKESDGDVKETRVFSSNNDIVTIFYTNKDKMYAVHCIYNGAINGAFIEMDIKNEGYKAKVVKVDLEGEMVNKSIWSIAGSELKFVTLSSEKEKMGLVAYGTYKE